MNIENIIVMDFSGIYNREFFLTESMCRQKIDDSKISLTWFDLKSLSGCNCYCDDDAQIAIEKKISGFSPSGIHFIDSGNYHYISKLWLEKIEKPFRLLVFDNHTDMQPPAFGGILSCGGWIAASVEELQNLKEVVLVGPDEESYEQVEEHIKKCTRYLSREALHEIEQNKSFFENIPTDLPLYISIDKDVLCKEYADTTWSQGDMKLKDLSEYLRNIIALFRKEGQEILGIDICGECDADKQAGTEKNKKANEMLLDLLMFE